MENWCFINQVMCLLTYTSECSQPTALSSKLPKAKSPPSLGEMWLNCGKVFYEYLSSYNTQAMTCVLHSQTSKSRPTEKKIAKTT